MFSIELTEWSSFIFKVMHYIHVYFFQDVAILDLTMLDEGNNIFWTARLVMHINTCTCISKALQISVN